KSKVSRQRIWQIRHRAKLRSTQRVGSAIKSGRMKIPEACERCGVPQFDLEGHHYLGYAPEHYLDVRWLCPKCHSIEHPHPNKPRTPIPYRAVTGKALEELRREFPPL